MNNRFCFLFLHCLLCFTAWQIPFNVQAAMFAQDDDGLAFSMYLQKHRADFQYGNETRQSQLSLLKLDWYEPINTRIKVGLEVGYLDYQQADHPSDIARTGQGEMLGFGLAARVLHTRRVDLNLGLAYRYYLARNSLRNESAEWEWNESQASAGLFTRLTEHLGLNLGTHLFLVDGTETITGTGIQTSHFETESSPSTSLSLEYQIDRGGYIGIEYSQGSREGSRLIFQRFF